MRSGYLRNKIYIQTYQTQPNGSGGTKYVYVESEDSILTQFEGRVLTDSGTVESVSCGSNFLTEFIESFVVWASIKQKQGSRGMQGGKIDLDNYTEFRFRFRAISDINKKWLIVYQNRRFTIHSYYVIDERKYEVIVNAVEVK